MTPDEQESHEKKRAEAIESLRKNSNIESFTFSFKMGLLEGYDLGYATLMGGQCDKLKAQRDELLVSLELMVGCWSSCEGVLNQELESFVRAKELIAKAKEETP